MAIQLYNPAAFPQLSQDGDVRRFLTGELAKISASIRSLTSVAVVGGLTGQILAGVTSAAPIYTSSPTISTSVTCPVVIGGTLSSSTLTLESTSGAGTSDAIIFKTGSQVERARIDTAGIAYVNTTTNRAQLSLGVDTNVNQAVAVTGWHGFAVECDFYLTAGASEATQTAVSSSAIMARLSAFGSDGTAFRQAAKIEFSADAAPSTSTTPGKLVFFTTPAGSSQSPIERLRIDSSGNATFGGFANANIAGSPVQFEFITTSTTPWQLGLVFCGGANSFCSTIAALKTRGSTPTSQTLVANNDGILEIIGYGSDGVNHRPVADMLYEVDGAAAAGNMPGRVRFRTNRAGVSLTEALRIDSAGLSTFTGNAIVNSAASQTSLTLNPLAASTNTGLLVNQSLLTTTLGGVSLALNNIIVSADNIALGAGNHSCTGFEVDYTMGGSTLTGERDAIRSSLNITAATTNTGGSPDAVSNNARIFVTAGYTGGGCYSYNGTAFAQGPIALDALIGQEIDIGLLNSGGAPTCQVRLGCTVVGTSGASGARAVSGADAAFAFTSDSAGQFKVGLLIGYSALGTASGTCPITSTGAVITTDLGGGLTIGNGIDLSGITTITNYFLRGASGTTFNVAGNGGVDVGNPGGGNLGAGKINVATGIFLNNTAYTNPDYALEHYYTGQIERFKTNRGAAEYKGLLPIAALDAFMREKWHLPGVPRERPADIFERADYGLQTLEEHAVYIVQLHRRMAELERV